MVGGDSKPSSKSSGSEEAAESPNRGSAAPLVDPGDRDSPLEPEEGDPFEPDLSELQRAARLEGRKIITINSVGSTTGEAMYRVDRFRRFLPNRGSDGQGLIQFWGPRASRVWVVGKEAPPGWTADGQRRLRTVTVGEIRTIKSAAKSKVKKRIKVKVR